MKSLEISICIMYNGEDRPTYRWYDIKILTFVGGGIFVVLCLERKVQSVQPREINFEERQESKI